MAESASKDPIADILAVTIGVKALFCNQGDGADLSTGFVTHLL